MSLMVSEPRSVELPSQRTPLDPPGRFARSPRRAESFYRKAAGSAAFLSGLLVFTSILMIPFDGVGSEGYLRSNAEHPDAIRWAAVVLHYGFLLLVPASLGMGYLARRGSRSLANLGLVLAVLGSGLSGLMAVDYYDLALATTLPMDQAVEVYDAAAATAGAAPMFIQLPSVLGTMLGTIVLAFAFRRAGFGSWFAPLAMTAGWLVFLVGAQHFAWAAVGTGLLAAATVLIGLRILYASDHEWETGVPD
jgi:hypothetical protein